MNIWDMIGRGERHAAVPRHAGRHMKIKELIRYLEETAPRGSMLYFHNANDGSYSTGQAEYISGSVSETPGLFKPSEITLGFRAAANGISLQREDLLAWLGSLSDSYGPGTKVLIRLHDDNGNGHRSQNMLTDKMWSRIEHEGHGRYALTEPTKAQSSMMDAMLDEEHWRKVAYYGGSGS